LAVVLIPTRAPQAVVELVQRPWEDFHRDR
jgi:hypothetical protein